MAPDGPGAGVLVQHALQLRQKGVLGLVVDEEGKTALLGEAKDRLEIRRIHRLVHVAAVGAGDVVPSFEFAHGEIAAGRHVGRQLLHQGGVVAVPPGAVAVDRGRHDAPGKTFEIRKHMGAAVLLVLPEPGQGHAVLVHLFDEVCDVVLAAPVVLDIDDGDPAFGLHRPDGGREGGQLR